MPLRANEDGRNLSKLLLVDYGDTELTNETLSIVESVFEEYQFPTDKIDYLHATRKAQLEELTGYDLIITFGAEAMHKLCKVDYTIKDYAGCLTFNEDLKTWVLPTMHPNRIYQEFYGDFDITYSHLRRAVDMFNGVLAWPSEDDRNLSWTFYGHNGAGWDPREGYNPIVWSGYFEANPDELTGARQTLEDWLAKLDSTDEPILFGIDTESYNLDHLQPLTMVQVYDGERAYAFNWGVVEPLKELWVQFLCHPMARFVWHNMKHDAKMIRQWLGVIIDVTDERHDDTMAWALGLTEKLKMTGLKYLARQYCNAPFWDEGLKKWLSNDKTKINYGHIRPDVLAEYGCLDVFYTYKLAAILRILVEREGTKNLVQRILLPAQRTFSDLEFEGIRVDMDYARSLQEEWEPVIDQAIKDVQEYAREHGFPKDPGLVKGQIYREICKCVPLHLHAELRDGDLRCTSYAKYLREEHKFNPRCTDCNQRRYIRRIDDTINVRSNLQMQHLCFDVLEMDMTWEGRKTNKYFWEINQSHPFAQLVAKYRELDYLNRNIIQGFGKFVRADGRIHPDFLVGGTTSGRLAVHDPAMQTVPARSKTGKKVKRLFKPDEGCILINVDYSNLELYMAHHLTKDDALLQALEKDMHRTTAAAMYMKAYEDVTADERQSAKPVNFGAGYNIKAKKLSRDKNLISITQGQASKAQQFLDAFWGTYTKWDVFRKAWIDEAKANCELRTEMGRVRRWSLITRENVWKVENQATNFKGQSMASDLTLMSLIQLNKQLKANGWGRVMLSVHDSIVFSVKPEYLHEAVALIQSIMTTPVFETTTPFKVDVEVGLTYGSVMSYAPNCPAEHVINDLVWVDENEKRRCKGCDG
jgi:DNA polymerase I-like protein with 3'-5' exonuclease and polymerase domains